MNYSNKAFTRIIVGACALMGLYTLGPAPINGQMYNIKPHTNLQKQDEKTLESEQHPVTMDQVGGPVQGHVDVQMQDQSGSQDATAVFNAAQRGGKSSSDSNASQVLGAASERLQNSGSSHSWIWALVLVTGIIGGIFGVKRWADNNIPNAPNVSAPKRDTW
jgi:hypothetical protein